MVKEREEGRETYEVKKERKRHGHIDSKFKIWRKNVPVLTLIAFSFLNKFNVFSTYNLIHDDSFIIFHCGNG